MLVVAIMQIAVINLNSISENYDLPSFNSRRRLTVIAWMIILYGN